MQHDSDDSLDSRFSVRKWLIVGFLLIAGFFLVIEHRAHLFGWLPYLLLRAQAWRA